MLRFAVYTIAATLLSFLMVSVGLRFEMLTLGLENIDGNLGCRTPQPRNSPAVLFVPFEQNRNSDIVIYGASEIMPASQETIEGSLHF